MRGGHLFLGSFVLLPVVGSSLLSHPTYRRFSPASRAVLAGAVGALLLSVILTALAVVGLAWSIPTTLALAFAAGLALRLLLRGAEIPGDGPPARTAGASVEVAFLLCALSAAAALLATAAGAATSNDLVFFWGPKAQQFARARTIDAAFLGDPLLQYMHAYYPPLVTNLFSFGAMAAGRLPWGAVTLTFPLLLAALAAGLPGALRPVAPRGAAAAASALVVSAISLAGIRAAVGGNGEMPLLLFETLAMALLVGPAADDTAGRLLAGLLLAGAASSKLEGLPYALAAAFLLLAVEGRRRAPAGKTLLLLLGPTAAALGLWFAYGASRKLFYGYKGMGRYFDLHFDHTARVLTGIARSLWSVDFALPYLIPLLVFLLSPRKAARAAIPMGVAAALAAFLVFSYLHGADDPTVWVGWSAARVFLPVAPLFVLAGVAGPAREAG